jgi:hypothetical protein
MRRPLRGMHSGACLLLCGLMLPVAGCSPGGDAETDSAAGDVAPAGLAVCDLLMADEVTGLLPGHDGGVETRSGESLVQGASMYQCAYTSRGTEPADFDLLTLTVTVAATAEALAEVRPVAGDRSARYGIFREIQAGEGGFAYGDAGDFMVDAWQGSSVVSLELVVDGAADREDDLVALAVAALSRID